MARATSGLGQFRGKVGSVVFRVNKGQQIASAYQPAVRNPKSNLQTAQRNKMYLASQLSKAVPKEDIIGLMPMGSARDRRSMFIRNILDNAVSTLEGETFYSRVNYSNVLFSNGRSIILGATKSGENGLSIAIGDMTEEEYNRLAIKAISFYATYENGIESYKSQWLELPTYTQVSQGSITIQGLGVDNIATYLVPVMLEDNVRYSRERKTLVQLVDGVDFIIAGEYNVNNAVLSWGRSYAFVSGEFGEPVTPDNGGDEVVNPDGPNFPNLG